MKELKEILGEELYNEVKEKIGDKELIINNGTYIPKSKFDTLNETKKDLEEQLKTTNEKVQELSKVNPDELNQKIEDLQKKYDEDTKALEDKYNAREYDIKLNDYVKDLKFSSKGSKKAFMEDLKAKGLQFENERLVGFDDFVNSYKENDPNTFMEEKKEEPEIIVNTGEDHNSKADNEDDFINRVMGLE